MWLHDRLHALDLDMPGLTLTMLSFGEPSTVFGLEYFLLSLAFTGLMLWLAGKLFDCGDG